MSPLSSTLPLNLLRRDRSLLIVVDMQEPFLSVIHDRERLVANVRLLIQAAQIMGIPVIASTQYRERMGEIVPEIAALFSSVPVIDKLAFSCTGSPEFMAALESQGRNQIVLCGVETHICVSQTAQSLVAVGYQVHVAADAVSSRSLEKHKLGMERIRDNHILPCAAEAAVYEWLGAAGTPEFKSVLQLVKSTG